jgi:hypothetical protein
LTFDRVEPGARARRRLLILAIVGVVLGVAIRILMLPAVGLPGDIDQFVLWVNHIATSGLPHAYDEDLAFGPVMAYIWAFLGAVEPAFRTAVDSSDPWLRALMKLPGSLADFGLAAGVAYALRERPTWATIGAVVVLLHPGTWFVSAWWGQYESIYLLAALAAVLFAIAGRNGLAAAALAVAVVTKPQAIPFMIPFAAWFYARGGVAELGRATVIGGVVALVLWLPFIPNGGPLNYLEGIARFQNDVFSVLSARAWNVWWLLQEVAVGGEMASDRVAILGPISFRTVGFLVTGLLAFVVANRVWRRPEPRTLILGLAAITLVAFTFLTTMHERYAYGALVFLMLLIPEPRIRLLSVAFGVVFSLNLFATPPTPGEAGFLPVSGILGVTGSIAMIAITLLVLREVGRPPERSGEIGEALSPAA